MDFCLCFVFFVKNKTAYEMRISVGSSDVCSSDLCRSLSFLKCLVCLGLALDQLRPNLLNPPSPPFQTRKFLNFFHQISRGHDPHMSDAESKQQSCRIWFPFRFNRRD